jgi:ferredoxin-NADP reductase
MINPLWSTRELRGRIEQIRHEAAGAATVLIKPGFRWPGHQPGQFLRIGLDIDGVRHWRAYSLTSDPCREDGLISITVKAVDVGKVSPYLVRQARPGTIVSLRGVEGDFVLPEEPPPRLLFISAGSGITPIMSMLRHLDHTGELRDTVLLHSARHTDEVIFGDELRALARRSRRFRLPGGVRRSRADPRRRRGRRARPSLRLPRRHLPPCVGELRAGRVRDLRNGKVYGQEGQVIRTCISAPEGPIEIDL